jgi:hypothetical protein
MILGRSQAGKRSSQIRDWDESDKFKLSGGINEQPTWNGSIEFREPDANVGYSSCRQDIDLVFI